MNRLSLIPAALLLAACGQPDDTEAVSSGSTDCAPSQVESPASVEITAGLTSRMLVEGCGDGAEAGSLAVVHYTGWLFDAEAPDNRGAKFDSSRDRGKHFEFPLGGGRVIKGWDKGVVGMTVGEVRELTIAPEMAYGDRNIGSIPAGSTLVFEVELADVVRPQVQTNDASE